MSFDTVAGLLRTRIDSRWGIVWASLLLLRLVVSYFFLFFLFYLSSRRKRRNEDKQRQNFPLLSWVEWRTVIQVEELSVRVREREMEIGTQNKSKKRREIEKKGDISSFIFLFSFTFHFMWRVSQVAWPRSDTSTLFPFYFLPSVWVVVVIVYICRE